MNALLAHDPALPQRDVLIDEAVMAQYLSHLVASHGDFDSCKRLRTKYRVGTSLRVLYEVRGSGHSHRIAARAFPRAKKITNQFNLTRELHAPELNTIFWIFPDDRKIKHLAVLSHLPAELRNIQGGEWIHSRIVGHAPEKTVTAQCLDTDHRVLAYAKIYAGDEGRRVYDVYKEIEQESQLRIPRALSYSEAHHLLLLESVPGVPLSTLTLADRVRAYSHLGEALRRLHELNPPSTTSESTRLTPEGLARAATIIAQARPEVAETVHQLADDLIATHDQIDEAVLLHGDLHPKNVLIDDDRLSLLDLDQAATGPAAIDLAGVIAGLRNDACLGLLTHDDGSSLITAFVNGYGVAKETLRWHVAAALLEERALRAVTRIRFGGLQRLPEILSTAKAVLNGGIRAH